MFDPPLRLRCPGLFITGTDTEVGKTVVTCAIAAALRGQLLSEPGRPRPRSAPRSAAASFTAKVGVCKPFSSGCRRDREGLVNEDAEALAHFADCRLPLDVINPIRFAPPLAPAVAAEQTGKSIDWTEVRRSLNVLDEASDALLIEGVGGVMVPLDPAQPRLTVLDLVAAIGYPVLIVARSNLGTLNHTAMTVRLVREAGCRVAGIVMNSYDADVAKVQDPSVTSNRVWLERLTGTRVIAAVPRLASEKAAVQKGVMDQAILDAISLVWWPDVLREANPL